MLVVVSAIVRSTTFTGSKLPVLVVPLNADPTQPRRGSRVLELHPYFCTCTITEIQIRSIIPSLDYSSSCVSTAG